MTVDHYLSNVVFKIIERKMIICRCVKVQVKMVMKSQSQNDLTQFTVFNCLTKKIFFKTVELQRVSVENRDN